MISIIVAIITAIASIIVAKIANNKIAERKIMIMEKLSLIMERDAAHNKFEVSKLFEELTGLQYKYSEIKNILNEDNAIWIIYTLQKIPGYVKYEHNQLVYNNIFKNNKVRKSFQFMEKLYLSFFILIVIFSIISFIFSSNNIYLQSLSTIIFVIFMFFIEKILKSIKITKQVREQIEMSNNSLEEERVTHANI